MAISTLRCVYAFSLVAILLVLPSRQASARRRSQNRQRAIRHCPDDMFHDEIRRPHNNTGLNCRPCSHCLPGFGVRRLCTRTEDTQCAPCPAGFYSESSNMWDDCLRCRECGRNQAVLRACTTASNTVCSQNCRYGYFYSPYDQDCLACSPCHQPGDRKAGIVAAACREAGMNPDMQCWPSHAHSRPVPESQPDLPGANEDSTYIKSTTTLIVTSKTDAQSPSTRPSPGPADDDDDTSFLRDKQTAQLYTFILLTLLCIVGLCIILSVAVLVCLSRLMRLTRNASRRNEKNGYQCLSKSTANLLVRGTAHV